MYRKNVSDKDQGDFEAAKNHSAIPLHLPDGNKFQRAYDAQPQGNEGSTGNDLRKQYGNTFGSWNDKPYVFETPGRITPEPTEIVLNAGQTIIYDGTSTLNIRFIGEEGTSGFIKIGDTTIEVKNENGILVWDVGGQEYPFHDAGEATSRVINGITYVIGFKGFGSLSFVTTPFISCSASNFGGIPIEAVPILTLREAIANLSSGPQTVNFSYSFVPFGVTVVLPNTNLYMSQTLQQSAGYLISNADFKNEIIAVFTEWKQFLEKVFSTTGGYANNLTVNFTNLGDETTSPVIDMTDFTKTTPIPSGVGDFRIVGVFMATKTDGPAFSNFPGKYDIESCIPGVQISEGNGIIALNMTALWFTNSQTYLLLSGEHEIRRTVAHELGHCLGALKTPKLDGRLQVVIDSTGKILSVWVADAGNGYLNGTYQMDYTQPSTGSGGEIFYTVVGGVLSTAGVVPGKNGWGYTSGVYDVFPYDFDPSLMSPACPDAKLSDMFPTGLKNSKWDTCSIKTAYDFRIPQYAEVVVYESATPLANPPCAKAKESTGLYVKGVISQPGGFRNYLAVGLSPYRSLIRNTFHDGGKTIREGKYSVAGVDTGLVWTGDVASFDVLDASVVYQCPTKLNRKIQEANSYFAAYLPTVTLKMNKIGSDPDQPDFSSGVTLALKTPQVVPGRTWEYTWTGTTPPWDKLYFLLEYRRDTNLWRLVVWGLGTGNDTVADYISSSLEPTAVRPDESTYVANPEYVCPPGAQRYNNIVITIP